MDNKKGLVPLIALLIAICILGSFVIGIVIGKNVDSNSHVQAAMPIVNGHSANAERVSSTLHYEFFAIITVRDICRVQQPIKHNVHIIMHTVRTNVPVVENEEDNNNEDIVIIPTPTISTITSTPEPTSAPIPTVTSTPEPTQEPELTATPEPINSNCNNGLGNGPDCPPPGHDKDDDGKADKPKGDNDDDNSNRPCGDKGKPCNNSGKNSALPILPLFSILLIGNPLLDHLLRVATDVKKTQISPLQVKIDYDVLRVQIHDIMNKSHYATTVLHGKDKDGDYPGDISFML